MEPNNVGLDELITFFRTVGAEPLVCVRFSGKTPQDAANQVQYCNGTVDTPYGKRRAENGHPEPYGVKYWHIGNEVRSEEYDARLPEFCRAMKAVDPSIKLLSSTPTRGLLRSAGQYLDYTCPHLYYAADLEAIDRAVERYLSMIEEDAPGQGIKLAVTEWNGRNPNWGTGRAWLWTLDNALKCARFHNYMHRRSDVIEIAIRSNLAGSFCGGALQTDNARLFKTPVYFTQALYGQLQGDYSLKVESSGDDALDISATISKDGNKLTLFAINDSEQPAVVNWILASVGEPESSVQVWTLGDSERSCSRDVVNSFEAPTRVAIRRGSIEVSGAGFAYEHEPLTLTVFKVLLR